jgi:hypothetical protein
MRMLSIKRAPSCIERPLASMYVLHIRLAGNMYVDVRHEMVTT